MRKYIYTFAFFLLLLLAILVPSSKVMAKETSIDKSLLDQGVIIVNYDADDISKIKVSISKGNNTYTYSLSSHNQFPLQMGNGKYTVSVLEFVKDNKYRVLEKEEIELELSNNNNVFLQSIQMINWNSNMKAIKKAKELTKGKKTEIEKVKAIYDYVVSNIEYDKKKAKNVSSNYLPSINSTFKENSGICFDYSALFAAMLRSVDVPTKLVMGNKSNLKGYHAWNQVYLSDTKQWISIDTTYDAGSNKKESMQKNNKDYTVNKVY